MTLKSLVRGSPLAPVARPLWRGLKRLWERRPGTADGRTLPGVVGRVHRDDAMLYDESDEAVRLYLRAANSAVAALERSLDAAGRTFAEVGSCLDFGCGHGRVLRMLVQRIPSRRITVCDIDAEAVRFCVAEFGVRGFVSSPSLTSPQVGRHDLIWVGSVLTHLRPDSGVGLLRVLGESLEPGGILVFSTHGQFVYDNLSHLYDGALADHAEAVAGEVREHGVSFRPYPEAFGPYDHEAYGMTFHTEAFLSSTMDRLFSGAVRRLLLEPRGWDDHHDIHAFRRVAPGTASG